MRKVKIEKIRYYREELDEYSPMMNAKILGKDIFDSDVITSMILYLEDKGWDGNTEIAEDNKTFLKHEKLFIKEIKPIFLYIQNRRENKEKLNEMKNYIEIIVVKDLINEGLLKEEYMSKENLHKEDILTFILFMVNILFICKMMDFENETVIKVTKIIQIMINSLWMILYFINMKLGLYFISYLSNEGKIYAEKLKASKRFLKNYTLISEKEIKSEIIFKSYLRNAIFFNLKGPLDIDAKRYYSERISNYGYLEKRKNSWIYDIVFFILIYGIWILLFINGDMTFKLVLANFLIYPFMLDFMTKSI